MGSKFGHEYTNTMLIVHDIACDGFVYPSLRWMKSVTSTQPYDPSDFDGPKVLERVESESLRPDVG